MVKTSITLVKRRENADGTYPVCVQVREGRNRKFVRTGINVRAENWDPDTSKVKLTPRASTYNTAIAAISVRVDTAVWQMASSGREYSFEEAYQVIREQVVSETTDKAEDSSQQKWLAFFMRQTADTKNSGSRSTYLRALKHIEEYIKPKRDVLMADITPGWLRKFDKYLEDKGLAVNTRGIYMRDLRAVFNAAIDDRITSNYPFRKFKIKTEKTPKRSLKVEDMRRLFQMDVPEWIRPYLDFFLLSFLLIGINPKDLLYARRRDVVGGRLTFNRAKTGRLYSILIPQEAWNIIDRYRGHEYLLSFMEDRSDYLQFVRYANHGLKSIGLDWSPGVAPGGRALYPELTTYWARHTWATIASFLNVPKDTISKALGHGPFTVTDVYIDYDQRKVDQANYLVISHVFGRC